MERSKIAQDEGNGRSQYEAGPDMASEPEEENGRDDQGFRQQEQQEHYVPSAADPVSGCVNSGSGSVKEADGLRGYETQGEKTDR